MNSLINKQQVIDIIQSYKINTKRLKEVSVEDMIDMFEDIIDDIKNESSEPEYKLVTAEDFAKTMSENTLYQYMVWYGMELALMKEQGFVICKTM